MASVEISSLLVLNSHNSYVSHNFYVVSPLPFWKYSDIVMVRIRRIIQSTVESFPEGSVLLLPQRLSRQQAACRSLNSHQPVLWAPPLDDPLPGDQQSCQTPRSTSQAPPSVTPSELTRFLLLWFEWADPFSPWACPMQTGFSQECCLFSLKSSLWSSDLLCLLALSLPPFWTPFPYSTYLTISSANIDVHFQSVKNYPDFIDMTIFLLVSIQSHFSVCQYAWTC